LGSQLAFAVWHEALWSVGSKQHFMSTPEQPLGSAQSNARPPASATHDVSADAANEHVDAPLSTTQQTPWRQLGHVRSPPELDAPELEVLPSS